jgi:putative membrane protein
MSKTEVEVVKPRSLPKGVIAGLIGGLAGVVAMTLAQRLFPPHKEEEAEATQPAAEPIHWEFGAAVGAAYGALAEYYPAATAKEGASFGVALEALTQQTPLPALGLPARADETMIGRAGELTSHVVYGVTTEWVRRLVRRFL